ncbi:MAG TPA: RDD family protein [Burkholderiaceae bacterium]|nr:RDD family protein [Burkholderiaceae bacterium]
MNVVPGKLPPMPDSRRTTPAKSDMAVSAHPDGRAPIAPSLVRRMACFVYEALLLFGIGLIPGALGAIFVAWTGHQQLAQIDTGLRVITFAIYALYFTWFWSARGQTLAMQTWHIRVVTTQGRPLGRWRALARYVASWAWVAPAALVAHLNGWTPLQSLAAVGVGVVVYALLALAHPQRQFWHDALCGSRLIDARPLPTA